MMFRHSFFQLPIGIVLLCLGAGCSGGGGHHSTATVTATAPPTATPTAASPGTPTAIASSTTGATSTATASALPTPTATPDASCPVGPVTTTVGVVCGTTAAVGANAVRAFLGIPFAEDTGGANRWQPPVPKAALTGRFQATHFGPICPQDDPTFGLPQSEDCLSINVWTPVGADPGANLPVMAFVYGGSFLTGSGAFPIYDGAYLSSTQDAVVVTFNYRVGALGFLAGVEGLQGNYGIRDQQLALHWVADNIAAFGGDASQVLFFGESAGAMSVGLHVFSIPTSEGLFASVLMESNPFAIPYKTPAEASDFGVCLEQLLDCPSGDLACMRGKTAEEIVAVQANAQLSLVGLGQGLAGFLLWPPVVDGTLIIQQPLAGITDGLPTTTLLGTNRDEGTLFVYGLLKAIGVQELSPQAYTEIVTGLFGATASAQIEAAYPPVTGDNAPVLSQLTTDYVFFCSNRFVARAGVSPVYAYEFDKVSSFNIWPDIPQCATQVCHADELPYVFHTATNIGATFLPSEEVLSQSMAAYWGAYSREGSDPNNGGFPRPQWPPFLPDLTYLLLDTPIGTAIDPPHHCDLWDGIGYEAVTVAALTAPQITCHPPATP